MHDTDRETTLHKIVAVSGFLFALCILPVAQYYLVQGKEEGQNVAGASTESAVVRGAIPKDLSPEECRESKDQQLTELNSWNETRLAVLTREYDVKVAPYIAAKGALQGTPSVIAEETRALDQLIAAEEAPYTEKKNQITQAVTARKAELDSSCQ